VRTNSDTSELGTAFRRADEPIDPAFTAADIVIAEALRADRGLWRRSGRGAVTVLHAPSADWCEPFAAAWRASALNDSAPERRRNRWVTDTTRHDEVATKPLTRAAREDAEQAEAIQKSVRLGYGVLAVSQDPDLCLPRYLLAAADDCVRLRAPDVADLHLIASRVTGGTCPPLRRPREPLSPAHLRLAVRPQQGPGDYVRRVLEMTAADRPEPVEPRVPPPGLDGLHGMAEAVAWGRAAARDLRAYAAGNLAWSEVDRGALLSGPTGTGKTTFAKRFASECGVPLIATSYSEWSSAGNEGHSGELMICLRKSFAEARKRSPCVLFIDELDSIPTRGATKRDNEWWVMVVNGLLAEMDGIETREGVIILGASNFADRVDPAIRRSGRLDRVIRVDLPDRSAMEAILLGYLDGALAPADVAFASGRGLGASGADAERWCRGARRRARQEGRAMTATDLLEEIGGGDTRSPERRLRIAYHEAGHALSISLRRPGALSGISIRQSGMMGGATGWTYFASEGDTPETINGLLRDILAGRAAEEVVYGAAGAGCGGPASSDLAQATLIAASAELAWGLGEALCWRGDPEPGTLPHMLAMHRDVAERVELRLRTTLAEARDLLILHRRGLDALAAAVAEQETLSGEEAALVIAGVRGPATGVVDHRMRANKSKSAMHEDSP